MLLCRAFKIEGKNGSFQIFPGENSFCVTATVLNDLISAIENSENQKELLENYYTRLFDSNNFLINNIESHALIGNHLMTALSAISKFNKSFNINENHNLENILKRLRTIWNDEGWFKEYAGSDIGYLTLTLDYLVDIPNDVFEDKFLWEEKILSYLLNFSQRWKYRKCMAHMIIFNLSIWNGYCGPQLLDELSNSVNLSKIPRPENGMTKFVPLLNSFIKFLSINFEQKDKKHILFPI